MLRMTRRGLLSLLARLPVLSGTTLAFTGRAADHPVPDKPRVLQGPMVGAVGPDRALLWMRTASDADVQVEWSTRADFADPRGSGTLRTHADAEHVALVPLSGLRPRTRHYYRVLVDGRPDPYLGRLDPAACSFVTAPAPGERAGFRLAFGSCARRAVDPEQAIWHRVAEARPDLFCWLGDNVYVDSTEPQAFSEEYRLGRGVAALQPLLRSVPQFATWDDNDYGPNNGDRTSAVKEDSLRRFHRYWANPSGGLPDVPGVFFRQAWGAVDLFFLDGRYHRDPNAQPDGPGKTMLGRAQREWLERGLAASNAAFKLVFSGSGWSKGKGPGGDAWSSFLHERDALFDFIRDRNIGGVVLLSGDTHVGELNCIPWSSRGGYDFYELVSSPLAQGPSKSWITHFPEARIRQVCFDAPLFGIVDVDFPDGDAELRFNLVTARGELAWDGFAIRASQLANGVASWRDAMDPVSRRRHAAMERGEPYYAQ